MKWTRLDNVEPYCIGDKLGYIREEAECMDFKFEEDAIKYVWASLSTDFPRITEKLSPEDMYVEYDEHELCDGETQPTYAVYIHLSNRMVDVLHGEFPELLI